MALLVNIVLRLMITLLTVLQSAENRLTSWAVIRLFTRVSGPDRGERFAAQFPLCNVPLSILSGMLYRVAVRTPLTLTPTTRPTVELLSIIEPLIMALSLFLAVEVLACGILPTPRVPTKPSIWEIRLAELSPMIVVGTGKAQTLRTLGNP